MNTTSEIINFVLEKRKLTLEEIRARYRQKVYVDAREEIAKRLRQEGLSYPEIGKVINRSHCEVIHLVKKEAEDREFINDMASSTIKPFVAKI